MNKQMGNKQKNSILLISIDALKPEFVFNQEKVNVTLPFLTSQFVEKGCIAPKGMKSVFPPFTYPCHQSMITGTNPVTHGIVNNAIFDPMNEHRGAWHWFANKKVLTLWEAAHQAGYVTASAAFPTSVGAKGDYIAPEFWWDGSALDSLFIDAVSRPQGLIAEMESDIGQYAGGLDLSDEGDIQRYRAATWLLEHKLAPAQRPFFMTAYFASFDESAHEYGVYSREAAKSLEKIDAMVGKLVNTAKSAAAGNLIVCVVSDHGTLDNTHNIFPNVIFHQEGLIKTNEKDQIVDWKAYSQRAGGIAEVRLSEQNNSLRQKVAALLERLKADSQMGILDVLTEEQARERGGFPDADFVLISRKGYEIRDDWNGNYLRTTLTQKAQHGYSEEFPEMRASFMIAGPGITDGIVENVQLIDVAPTLAALMGFTLPDAEGRDVLAEG